MFKTLGCCLILSLLLQSGTFAETKKTKVEDSKAKIAKEASIKDTKFKTANGVKLRNLKGGLIDLSHYKGKVLVINFFATWCPPCVKETPEIVELQRELGSNGVQVFGISVDDTKDVLAPFIKKNQINYPIAMYNPDLSPTFGDIEGIPTTFIINRQLQIVDRFTGYTNKSDFYNRIKKWL